MPEIGQAKRHNDATIANSEIRDGRNVAVWLDEYTCVLHRVSCFVRIIQLVSTIEDA